MEHHHLQNQVIFFNLFLPVSKKKQKKEKCENVVYRGWIFF